MQPSTVLLLVLIGSCAITDVIKNKVYNVVTYPAILIGFLLGFVEEGGPGLISRLIGFAIGMFIMLIAYSLGGMGGGDVKLMGAIGAMGGYPFILNALFFSVMIGGILSLSIIIWQGKFLQSMKNIFFSVTTPFIPGVETQKLDPINSTAIPFGFAICFGTLWAMIENLIGVFT